MTAADQRLHAFLELPDGPAFLLSGDGVIQTANAKARAVLTSSGQKLEGESLSRFLIDDETRLVELLRRALGANAPTFAALTLPDQAGKPMRFRARATTIERSLNPVHSIIAVILDSHPEAMARFHEVNSLVDQLRAEIARRNSTEARLVRTLQALEQANEAKSEVLAHVSHEFRTPLNAIIGFSEIMRSEMFGTLNDRYAGYAQDIHVSGKHLLGIVDRILDLSKVEAGIIEIQEELFNLSEVLEQCEHIVRPLADKRGIRLLIPREIALPRLQADIRMVREILINLITNAIAYCEAEAEVSVLIRLSPKSLLIGVADNGPGIKDVDKNTLFEPFMRGGSVLTSKNAGSGLGLWLVRTFVAAHGGAVRLFNRPNHGTLAAVRLPRERAA